MQIFNRGRDSLKTPNFHVNAPQSMIGLFKLLAPNCLKNLQSAVTLGPLNHNHYFKMIISFAITI